MSMHPTTKWLIQPSLKYDALCFLNTLTGDPFYLEYYEEEYARFRHMIAPETQAALSNLKRTVKDEGGSIISALLCRYFSTVDDEMLDDMISRIRDDSSTLADALLGPYYYNKKQLFEASRESLVTILAFLESIGFQAYWQREILPKVEVRIATLRSELTGYNAIAEAETYLGYSLPSDEIAVYVLYYTRPHGIKLVGTRFLTDLTWDTTIVAHNAVHEMMHPPYDLESSEDLRDAILSLRGDRFLMQRFDNHNKDYGYNSFESFIEESCVRALDQVICEKWGIAQEPRERWFYEDGGMHVFAPCIYSVMREEQYNSKGETFADFLLRILRTKLAPGNIEEHYYRFYTVFRPSQEVLPGQ
jgi:hypothetical protein